MRARLLVRYPDRPSSSHWLDRDAGEATVGRSSSATVSIDHPSVSRHHAALRPAPGNGWLLRDLGSKNGTFHHDQRVDQDHPLASGDWLRFGDVYAEFSLINEELADQADRIDRQFTDSIELQRALKPSMGVAGLVSQTLDSILELSGYQRGFVLLRDDKDGWRVRAHRAIDTGRLQDPAFSGSLGAVERCLESASPVVACNIQPQHWLADRPSIVDAGIQALICMPLAIEDEILGVVYVDKQESGGFLSELDLDILASLTSHAALTLALARMEERMAKLADGIPPPGEERSEAVILRFDMR